MNREIKFRAWDGDNREMIVVENLTLMPNGNLEYWHDVTKAPNTIHNKSLPLMQYTGLKDKNGKGIYFGDILQTSNDNPEFDIWKSEDYGYAVCYEDPEELGVRFKNWTPTTREESIYNFQFVEIIGNIYQDSQLFKNQ